MEIKTEFLCNCGRTHRAMIDGYVAKNGALKLLPDYIKQYGGKRVFVFGDRNTFRAAGEQVCRVLEAAGIDYRKYVFDEETVEPDERSVGSLVMHFDPSCEIVIGVGSGVINDLGKILAHTAGKPYFIVATAPSMDGYASASSSMAMDGLKVSLPTRCANLIIGDVDIMKNAPTKMLTAGLGDMLAKYISIAEWRIAHLITGEYYCETVAEMVRTALRRCVANREGLLRREDEAVKAVFEGLVLGGMAMNYAGVSRPASGVEHYFSHVWDMRGLEFGTPVELHGIQCAVGTLYAARVYEQIKALRPDVDRALVFVQHFDYADYAEHLRAFLGKGAEAMIALEKKEGKYDPKAHAERLQVISAHWEEILRIIDEEISSVEELERILDAIGAPHSCEAFGIPADTLAETFAATKDIRDKYVASRLCFDLGVLEEIKL